ncbi:MAG: type II/IV secretion system ATPase subunit [bacterium]|nr:type II/IV secretion system ATPase subunit [bacterium]
MKPSVLKQILSELRQVKKKEKKKETSREIKIVEYKPPSVLQELQKEIQQQLPEKLELPKQEVPELKIQKKKKKKEKEEEEKARKETAAGLEKLFKKGEQLRSAALRLSSFRFLGSSEDYVHVEEYYVIPPLVKVVIVYNKKQARYEYIVVEPEISVKEKELIDKLEEMIVEEMEVSYFDFSDLKEAEAFVEKKLKEILEKRKWFIKEFEMLNKYGSISQVAAKIRYYVVRDLVYLGKIEPIMRDPHIEDISMDGINIPVYVYHRKYGSIPTNIVFTSLEEANAFIIKLAQKCRRHVSLAEPRLDGRLPDGSRVQATYGKEITLRGPTFTIRKFREKPYTPAHLIFFGTFSAELMAYMWFLIEHQRTFLVAGGTASGKTTTLNALTFFIPPNSKIITIEDTPEIRIPHENWIEAVARPGVRVGQYVYGEVTMEDLLKDALRQRPDYLIVGEIRGREANVLFQAVATGHAGAGTMHADSIEAVIHRLLIRPIELPPSLLEHLDCIIVQSRLRRGEKFFRRVMQVAEIKGIDIEREYPIYDIVYRWDPKQDKIVQIKKSYLLYEKLAEIYGYEEEEIKEELDKKIYFLEWTVRKRIFDYKDFYHYVCKYYTDKERLLKEIGYYESRERAAARV